MTSSPWQLQRHVPTREEAEKSYNMAVENFIKTQDANDMIYALDASRNYNPEPRATRLSEPRRSALSLQTPSSHNAYKE